MIFATCGSSHLPFDRMMEALAGLSREDLFVQHGPATPPQGVDAHPYLDFGQVVERIENADVVISHAGVGSIMCAVRAGHVPIVFPRLKRYRETVDDHQAELAEALQDRGNVIVAWTLDGLIKGVASVPPRTATPSFSSEGLARAVHAAIRGGEHCSNRRLLRVRG